MKKTKSNLQKELKDLRLKLIMYSNDKQYCNFLNSEIFRVKDELLSLNK